MVEFSIEDLVILKVLERKNLLDRPLVANIDTIFITFSAKDPKIEILKLQILLANSFFTNIKPCVIINKKDLLSDEEFKILKQDLDFLNNLGVEYYFVSANSNEGIENIKNLLKDKIYAFGGPSGAGKSSIFNLIQNKMVSEVGEVSKKIGRGKHTTKGASLLKLENNAYLIDTPGFASIELPDAKDFQDFMTLFPDFNYPGECYFNDCVHINEPKCYVKNLISEGKISLERYEFYKDCYKEYKERWKRYD